MKGIIKQSAMMLLIAVVGVSCVPQEASRPAEEPATLELSRYAVELSSDARTIDSAPMISVETNQATVKVQSLAPEWLTAEYRANGIYLAAQANQSGVKRSTNVLVFAGDKFEVVKVIQGSSAIYLEVSPTSITVPAAGETVLVDVRSNGTDWKYDLSEEDDWLKVTRINNFLQVTVLPNTMSSGRVARVYVEMNGATPSEIIVTQQAFNNGTRFGLPLLEKNPTEHAILDHEKNQGSYLIKYVNSNLGQKIEIPYLVFLYSSPVFSTVTYRIVDATKTLNMIEMISSDPATLLSDEFIQTLIDRGFEITHYKDTENYTGINRTAGFRVNVEINRLKESKITFVPIV